MKIVFYNHYHRGDIHYSRSFVAHTAASILKNYPEAEFLYFHENSSDTVSDIPHVTECANSVIIWHNQVQVCSVDDYNQFPDGEKVIAINTWVGSDNIFRGDCGCCFTGNKKLWNRIWEILDKEYGLKIEPPENVDDLLPKINYDSYIHCNFIDEHLRNTEGKYRKRIFVSNGPVLSGQANNFDFDPIISKASQNHPDCAFYLTDVSGLNAPNIYRTRDLIQKDGCDLNENSYLSKFCEVLIGRGSGPFAFANCYDNFMDEDKTFCIFSNDIEEGAWYTNGKCKYEWYDPFIQIQKIIENSLGG